MKGSPEKTDGGGDSTNPESKEEISDVTAKEKAIGKRTRASVKADVVAPKEKKWWGHCIYVEDRLRQ